MKCEELEVYLSGYLDGELDDSTKLKVEMHLGECADCHDTINSLKLARAETQDLNFQEPSMQEWQRMERNIFASISRGLGWVVLSVWMVVTVTYSFYEYFSSPTEPVFQKILVFGFFLGIALLFLSVLSERMRDSRTDRYKGVQR